jgi:hypothetical protein
MAGCPLRLALLVILQLGFDHERQQVRQRSAVLIRDGEQVFHDGLRERDRRPLGLPLNQVKAIGSRHALSAAYVSHSATPSSTYMQAGRTAYTSSHLATPLCRPLSRAWQ